jgi:hypothetical protein
MAESAYFLKISCMRFSESATDDSSDSISKIFIQVRINVRVHFIGRNLSYIRNVIFCNNFYKSLSSVTIAPTVPA